MPRFRSRQRLLFAASLVLAAVAFLDNRAGPVVRPFSIQTAGLRPADQILERLSPPWPKGAVVSPHAAPPGEAHVRGVVARVEGRDTSVEIVVRTSEGRDALFRVDPAAGVTSNHLRQHMARREPVTVYYQQIDDALVAVTITD